MPSATAPHGMVATPHPLATAAGVEALRAGGTAVDAAVAANAMLAVVYCNACGLGGDAFALIWDPAEGRLHGFNGSGRSPAGLTIDRVRAAGHDTMPQRGPLTIDVPGAVDAWVQLLDRFGRRSLADALAPAAQAADDGYELTAITARAIQASLPTFDEAGPAGLLHGRRSGRPSASRSWRRPFARSPTAAARPTTAGRSARRSRAPSRPPAGS